VSALELFTYGCAHGSLSPAAACGIDDEEEPDAGAIPGGTARSHSGVATPGGGGMTGSKTALSCRGAVRSALRAEIALTVAYRPVRSRAAKALVCSFCDCTADPVSHQ
jgi:hypothetical protein